MEHIASFFHKVWGKLSKWRTLFSYNWPIGPKVYLIGTPTHNNVGDSAIVVASLKFLRECYPRAGCVKEMTFSDYKFFGHVIHYHRNHRSRVIGLGGGNMGDQWFWEEKSRRNFLASTKQHRPVIFPQTIYYSNTETGRTEQENSAAIYNDSRLTITAREKASYNLMKQLYPKANLLLAPDIVLSTTAADYGVTPQNRSGILWCLRSDKEKAMTPDFEESLRNCVAAHHRVIRKTDMYTDQDVSKQNRVEIVRQKMLEFASAELIITDRLHGMIFAAITETPCIVFGNNHHKVRGTYEWLRHLPYIRFAVTVADAERCIPELLEMKNCRFDNTPLLPYFQKLKETLCKENS